jgi:hypothetical protein
MPANPVKITRLITRGFIRAKKAATEDAGASAVGAILDPDEPGCCGIAVIQLSSFLCPLEETLPYLIFGSVSKV